MRIRTATLDDVGSLVPLYQEFYKTTDYARLYDCDVDTLTKLTEHIINAGAMIIVEVEDKIVGSAGAWVGPATFNKDITVAVEVVFYLDPTVRGERIAPRLIEALEDRCKELGAISLQMVKLRTSSHEVETLYRMNGYRPSESNFTKRLVR